MDGKDVAGLLALEMNLRSDRVCALAVRDQGIGFDFCVDDVADALIENAGCDNVFLAEPQELCGFVHNSFILLSLGFICDRHGVCNAYAIKKDHSSAAGVTRIGCIRVGRCRQAESIFSRSERPRALPSSVFKNRPRGDCPVFAAALCGCPSPVRSGGRVRSLRAAVRRRLCAVCNKKDDSFGQSNARNMRRMGCQSELSSFQERA